MRQVTEGIVLSKTNYSESSLIIKLLTPDSGIRSFIFRGAKQKGKKGNILSPLAVVHVDYYARGESDLVNISEINLAEVFRTIPFDPLKTSVLFFMNEVLQNAIHDQEESSALYDYVREILRKLDASEKTANYPAKFLVDLTDHLGFFPDVREVNGYFNLKDGVFSNAKPAHELYMSSEASKMFLILSETDLGKLEKLEIPVDIRSEVVRKLLVYFQHVSDGWKEIRSLPVLESTLRD